MHLGIHNLDPGRKAVGQNPARLALQDRHQGLAECCIGVVQMQGAGQLTLKALRHLQHLVRVLDGDDQAKRAEDLRRQSVVADPVSARHLEQIGRRMPHVADRGQDFLHAGLPGDPVASGAVGRGYAIGQHGLRTELPQGRLGCGNKGIGLRPPDQHGNAGFGAELARPHRQRTGPAPGQRLTPGLDGGGQQEHRVDRA